MNERTTKGMPRFVGQKSGVLAAGIPEKVEAIPEKVDQVNQQYKWNTSTIPVGDARMRTGNQTKKIR